MSSMRLVITFVGLICLGSVLGIIVLALDHSTIPDILSTLAVASLTGLCGLMARPGETAVIKP